MVRKERRPKDVSVGTKPRDIGKTPTELDSEIPDFTAEQWNWLKERALEHEKGYVPTRTIIEGL